MCANKNAISRKKERKKFAKKCQESERREFERKNYGLISFTCWIDAWIGGQEQFYKTHIKLKLGVFTLDQSFFLPLFMSKMFRIQKQCFVYSNSLKCLLTYPLIIKVTLFFHELLRAGLSEYKPLNKSASTISSSACRFRPLVVEENARSDHVHVCVRVYLCVCVCTCVCVSVSEKRNIFLQHCWI